MKRTKLLRGVVSLALLFTLIFTMSGCGGENGSIATSSKNESSSSSQNKSLGKTKIRLAVQPSDIQPYVASAKGFFEEEGLDVELQLFSYGPPIIEAITAKNIDVGLLGDLPAFSGIVNGSDINIIGTYGTSAVMHGLVVRDAANIKSLADLKGKKISTPFGSNAQPLLYLFLDKAGLTEKDVEILNVANADTPAALTKGDIDAAVFFEPALSSALKEGSGNTLLSTAEGVKNFVNPIIARGEFTKANPDAIAKFLKAFDKAAKWSLENPDEAVKIISEANGVDAGIVKIILQKRNMQTNLDEEKINALKLGAEQSFKYGLITKELDVEKYIDTSYLQKAGLQ